MSTRTRYLVMVGGTLYKGKDAYSVLGVVPGPNHQEEMKRAARAAGMRLWIFREPRSISLAKSRYKQLCRAFHLAFPRKTKKPAALYPRVVQMPREEPPQQRLDLAEARQALAGLVQWGANPAHAPAPVEQEWGLAAAFRRQHNAAEEFARALEGRVQPRRRPNG